MVYKLLDEIGTDFLYISYIQELKDFLNSVKDEPGLSIIDVSGVHFTPDIASIINEYTLGGCIKFKDSTNADRNKILAYNYQIACMVDNEDEDVVPLPACDITKIREFVKSLSKDVIYKVENNREEVLLAIFVSIMRPTIMLDISDCIATLSSIVNTALFSLGIKEVIATTNTFMYEYYGNWIEFTTDVKDLQEVFYVYGVGETTWVALSSDYNIIPAYFGKADTNIRKDPKLFKVWEPVISYVQNGLQECRQEKATLLNYMKGDLACLKN